MMFVDANGMATGYDMMGQGREVLLLHPAGLSRSFWRSVIEALPGNVSAVAIDLPGHGDSSPLGKAFTLNDLADAVANVVKALDLDKVLVVGCSMGGMVAQGLAIRHPALVSGLLLCNTSCEIAPAARPHLIDRAQAALGGMAEVCDATVERWFSARFKVHTPRIVDETRAMLKTVSPEMFSRSWLAIAGLDYAAELAGVVCPTIVVTGDEDSSVSPEAALAMTALLPFGACRVLQGGHMLPLEQPHAIASIIAEMGCSR